MIRRSPLLILLLLLLSVPTAAERLQRLHLRMIVVSSSLKAQTVLSELQAGKAFHEVAKTHSIDPSRQRGGYLGEMWLERMNAAFRSASQDLKQGRYSQPFRLGSEYVILYRVDNGFKSRAYQLAEKADQLLDENEIDEAIQTYLRAIEEHPDFIHGYFKLGVAYGRAGQPQKEGESYLKALKIEPEYPQAYYNLGALLLSAGNYRGAIESFRKSLRYNASQTACWVNISGAHQALGERDLAIRAARKAIDLNPLLSRAWFNLGAALGEQDARGALQAFEMAEALDPETADFPLSKAIALAHLGRIEEADTALRDVLKRFPDNEQARKALSQLNRARDSGAGSGPAARAAATPAPEAPAAPGVSIPGPAQESDQARSASLADKARAALSRGDFRSALQHYDEALRWAPDKKEILDQRAWTLVAFGRVLESQGAWEKAVEAWERALRGRPKFVPAWESLARLAVIQGRFGGAQLYLDRAREIEPANPDLRILRSRLLSEQRDFEGAVEELSGLRPGELSPATRLKLFEQLLWLDLDDQAIKLFRKLELPPLKMLEAANHLVTFSLFDEAERYLTANPSPQGQALLGKLYSDQLRFEEAESLLTGLLERYPQAWSAYLFLGNVYFDSGRAEKAVEVLRMGLARQPENVNLLHRIGQAALQAGHREEGLGWLRKAHRLAPRSARVNFELGSAFLDGGDPDSARKHLMDVLRDEPDHIRTHYLLGRLFRATGDLDESQRYLAKFQALKDRLDRDRVLLLEKQNAIKSRTLFGEL